MQNGNLTSIRVFASAVIGILGITGAWWLLLQGTDVPKEYFALCGLAITGVVGVDVVASIIKRVTK
jgi:hypothetical protein